MTNQSHIDQLKAGNKFEWSIWEYKVIIPASANNCNMAIVLNTYTNTECEFNGNILVTVI